MINDDYLDMSDKIDNLKEELEDERGKLHQIYSHLSVEAFGDDIQEQALKEIARLQDKLAEMTDKYNACQEARKFAIEDKKETIKERDKTIADLEAKLAEKEESINEIMKEFGLQMQDFGKCKGNLIKANQDKISFAVAELEKVSKYVDGRTYLAQYIQDRIKQLKKEK